MKKPPTALVGPTPGSSAIERMKEFTRLLLGVPKSEITEKDGENRRDGPGKSKQDKG